MNGRISEAKYDEEGVERDKDSLGNEVSRDFEISSENTQRAKVLSSKVQRDERLNLIATIKENETNHQLALKEVEAKRYKHNSDCENRIAILFNTIQNLQKSTTSTQMANETKESIQTPRRSFEHIIPNLTEEHFGRHKYSKLSKLKPTMQQMKHFIQVRDDITHTKRNTRVYRSFPKKINRDSLIDICLNVLTKMKHPNQFNE